MAELWQACRDGDVDRVRAVLACPAAGQEVGAAEAGEVEKRPPKTTGKQAAESLRQLLNWVHPQARGGGAPVEDTRSAELHAWATATPLGIAIQRRRHAVVALLLSFSELEPNLARVLGWPCQGYLQNALCWHWGRPLHPLDRFLVRPTILVDGAGGDHRMLCLLLADRRFAPDPVADRHLLMEVILHRDVRLFGHLLRTCAASVDPNFAFKAQRRSVVWYCIQDRVPLIFLRMLLACNRHVILPPNINLPPTPRGREALRLLQGYREAPQLVRAHLARSLGWDSPSPETK